MTTIDQLFNSMGTGSALCRNRVMTSTASHIRDYRLIIPIAFLLLLCAVCSNAQVLDRSIVVNGKDRVNGDYVFHDGDSLTFNINNIANADSLDWDVGVVYKGRVNGNSYHASTKQRVNGDYFGFSITPQLFGSLIDWLTKPIEYDNDSSVYTHAVIHLYNKTVALDSMSIYLNVLPSRPKFVKAELQGEFDYDGCRYQEASELSVSFTSHMMKGGMLHVYVSDSVFANEYPVSDWASHVIYPMDYLKENCAFSEDNGVYSLKFNGADWGEFYTVTSYNDYGGVDAKDAVNTTKVISDSNVVAALKRYYDHYTKVNTINLEHSPSVSYRNNRIYIGNNNCSIPIMIYSPDGRLVLRSTVLNSIDVSFLPQGVYYVKVLPNTGKCISFKFIKQG